MRLPSRWIDLWRRLTVLVEGPPLRSPEADEVFPTHGRTVFRGENLFSGRMSFCAKERVSGQPDAGQQAAPREDDHRDVADDFVRIGGKPPAGEGNARPGGSQVQFDALGGDRVFSGGVERHDLAGDTLAAFLFRVLLVGALLGGLQLRASVVVHRVGAGDAAGVRGVARDGDAHKVGRGGGNLRGRIPGGTHGAQHDGGGLTVRTALFLAIVVFGGTGGEICVSRAMKGIGEVREFTPRALLRVMVRAFSTAFMWLGIALMAVSFFSLLALLSWAPLSFVKPASALSYAVGVMGGKFLLGERVSSARWKGVFLVCLGVALTCVGGAGTFWRGREAFVVLRWAILAMACLPLIYYCAATVVA